MRIVSHYCQKRCFVKNKKSNDFFTTFLFFYE
nr:MAG TPA: hypothetical protein [Caudoviricetes sp.]